MHFYSNNIQAAFVLQSVLAIAIAVAIFAVVYIASMAIYFSVRKRHAYSRFCVEIAFMAVILLLSFTARFLLFLNLGLYADENIYADNTVAEIIGTALRAVYSSIGQLTFEGLEDYIGSGQVALGYWLFYWGTGVYCGVMFLSLVTTKISYEIYSKGGVFKSVRSKSSDDLFIFKNVTADTVSLAECIEKRYDEYRNSYRSDDNGAGGKYIPYAKMKSEQRRADELRVKINELTQKFIDQKFSFSETVDNDEQIKKYIDDWLIPALIWAAVCANVKDEQQYVLKDGIFNLNNIMHFSVEACNKNVISKLNRVFMSIGRPKRNSITDSLNYFNETDVTPDSNYLTKKFFKDKVFYNAEKCEIVFPDNRKFVFADCVFGNECIILMNAIISTAKEYIDIVHNLIDSVSKEEYSIEMSRKHPRGAKILFLGDSLGPFDGDNPLHREIMAHNYYYVSFLQDQKRPVSIFKKFKIDLKNDFLDRICDYRRTRKVSVFAFGLNDDSTGAEAYNSADVFNEIRMLFTECVKKDNINPQVPIVCYYVLADNEINYQAYDNKLKEVLKEVIGRYDVRMSVEEAMLHFQVNVVNEAELSAKCLVRKRTAAFNMDSENGTLVDDAKPFPDNSDEFRVAVLGFGQTGQTALKELYINTTFINKNIKLTAPSKPEDYIVEQYDYKRLELEKNEKFRTISGAEPTQFVADVFDSDADDLMGVFSYKNPLFICAKSDESYILNNFSLSDNRSVINIERMYNYSGGKYNIQRLCKGMGFPVVFFHETSCSAIDFLEVMDSASGVDYSNAETKPEVKPITPGGSGYGSGKKNYYKAFIISLGNDESNITMANALIDDIRHEYTRNDKETKLFKQTIYVNLRDERNNARLIYSAYDSRYLTVIPFGSSADMYSYENVIDSNEVIQYHTSYSYLTKENYEQTFKDYLGEVEAKPVCGASDAGCKSGTGADLKIVTYFNPYKSDDSSLYGQLCGNYENIQLKYRTYLNMRRWFNCNMFERQSNTASSDFAEFFNQYYKKKGNKLSAADFLLLSAIEHTRWNRFHISNGWIYANETNKPIKEHKCIIPFDMLYYTRAYSIMYDAGNVVVGIKRKDSGEEK